MHERKEKQLNLNRTKLISYLYVDLNEGPAKYLSRETTRRERNISLTRVLVCVCTRVSPTVEKNFLN